MLCDDDGPLGSGLRMRHCGGASSTDSDLPGYGARGGGHGIRAATAPSVPQLPAAGSGGGAFAATGRMARLAALYAGAPDAVSGGGPATFDELRVQSTADLSHPRVARMLSGDLNVTLADAEGASSPSSSTDLSPPDSEPSDLRSAARRMYLGSPSGELVGEAAWPPSPPRAAGASLPGGVSRPPLSTTSMRRLSGLAPPSALSAGAADIPFDTTRLPSGIVGLRTVSEVSDEAQLLLSPLPGTPLLPGSPIAASGVAAAAVGLAAQPPGSFSTAQSPFARMVAARGGGGGGGAGGSAPQLQPDPRNMYNSALEALRAKAVGTALGALRAGAEAPEPLGVHSEPAPAAFVPGSKEDAADAVATYTAAMRARSAAAAIGRTSPLRPKDEGALAGEGLRSVTLRSNSRSPWGSDLRMASVSETSPFATGLPPPPPPTMPAQPPPAAVAAVDNYVESLRRTSERLRADSTSDTARAAMAALRATASPAALPASQPAADAGAEAAMAGAPAPGVASEAAVGEAAEPALTPESEPAAGVSRVSGEVQKANLQVESYIESLRRRSKVRLRTTSSTPSGSPPVSRWSRGGSAASGSGSSSSGGNHMADLSEAARDAAAAAAEANAAAPLQLPAQDRAAKGPSPLKSASLRTPSVVLPLPTVTVANGPTAPATGTAVLAAATPAGASAPEQPKALLPTSEAVSAVSSYLDSLRGLSARGVSSGQMGGLLTASQSQRTAARQTSALSMPVLDPDPMPRSQTTPEAAAAAAVGGYLASLRSQSQMRGAGGALPWQRVHAVAEGANPQHTPLPLPPTDAAKAAKAAAVAAAMFGGDEDDDEEEEEGDGDHDTGADGPPAAAEAPDADEGDVDLRSDSLACLSLKDDPSTAGQFSLAATAAVASVRAQLQMRSASVRLSGASRGSGSAQQRHRSQSGPLTAEQLATGSIGGGEDVAFAAASGMNPPGDDGNDDPAIKRDSGGSDDSAQAPFKVAYSPFTAMAEAASKSSSASSEGNPRSDGAQDAVLAYMLALRQSSANRRQSLTAEDDDPNGEILRIDTPNQEAPQAPRNQFMAQHSNGSSFFGRSSNMTASLERLEEESEGPESAAGAVASYMASLKQKAVDAAAASRAASECVPASARPSFDGQASVDSVGATSVPASQPQSRTLSVAAVRMLKSSSAAPSPSTSGELGSAEPMRSAATSCALPMTRMSNGSSAAASGSASGSESRSGAAIGPATHVSSDSSSGSPFEAVAVAPGILPGMPSTSNRVLEGLDSLSRIGVTPPPALGAEDDQSMKGLTAVSEYLGDLRMRSVNAAMSRVGSRQNLSSTAAAFMDLAEEEEGDNAQTQAGDEYQHASEPLPSTLRVVPEVSPTGDAAIESSQQTDHWRRSSH